MLWNKILLLFDSTENALRAVEYVGKMFGSAKDVSVTIMGLLDPIPEHHLDGDAPGMEKLRASIHSMEVDRIKKQQHLVTAADMLGKAGVQCDRIEVKEHQSRSGLAKEIIRQVQEGGYGTVVLGYTESAGLFKFLSGDISSSLIKGLTGCTVCVVS